MISETAITKLVNGRALMWLMALLGILASLAMLPIFWHNADTVEGLYGDGLGRLVPVGFASWAANTVVILGIAVMLYILNKTYAFIREYTMMFVTVFLSTTFFNPHVSLALGTPTLLAFVLLLCCFVMFSAFMQPHRRSVVFLITAILTVCAMQSFVFALYIPVFLVGFLQMRIFSLKSLLAMIVGIVVPVWIAAAFGLIDPLAIRLPAIATSFSDYIAGVDRANLIQVAYVVVLGSIFGIVSVWTIISYRQQLRAYNGFFNILAIATLIMMAADPHDIDAFVVVINMLTAIQTAHFFTIRTLPKGYAVFLVLLVANIALSLAVAFNLFSL